AAGGDGRRRRGDHAAPEVAAMNLTPGFVPRPLPGNGYAWLGLFAPSPLVGEGCFSWRSEAERRETGRGVPGTQIGRDVTDAGCVGEGTGCGLAGAAGFGTAEDQCQPGNPS